jgi:hypothetical protein
MIIRMNRHGKYSESVVKELAEKVYSSEND